MYVCRCAVHCRVELIEFLHVHGADITMADIHGATPLHYAILMCSQHQQQQQQQQQQRDEEDNQTETCGEDVIMRLNVLRAVLMRTENIDLFDQQHRVPLIWAATCGNILSIYYMPLYRSICLSVRPCHGQWTF